MNYRTAAFLRPIACSLVLAILFASTAQAQVNPTERTPITESLEIDPTVKTPPGGFSAEANVSQTFSFDSNPLRTTTNARSITGSTTSPELVLREKTPTTLIESTSRIDANVYDRAEFNSVDVHENFLASKSNARWTAALGIRFDRDTTRESELTNYGSTLARVYSNRIGFTPQLTFRENERDTWLLNTSFLHDHYSDASYTDYNFYTIAPTYEHSFDAKNTGRIALNAQRYEAANGPSSSANSIGPSIGWTTKPTNRLTLRADAGAVSTDRQGTGANVDSGNWDYVFSAAATYKGTQDTVDVAATRAQEPFGNGTEALVDSVTAKATHAINAKLALDASAAYRKADYSDAQPGINLDHEMSVGGGVSYHITQTAALTADYTYHNENLVNQPGKVNEHIVMVGVQFHPSWGVL